jgi:hypothetical protein
MTDNLKTLKDIEGYQMKKIKVFSDVQLKSEAIKWVKDLEDFGLSTKFMWEDGKANPYEMVKWIKHFFNLTEEDLN